MANRVVLKRHVDPDIFKNFLKERNISIRQLGIYCDANERSIRRMLKTGSVSLTIAMDICQFFHVDFDEIFGPDTTDEWTSAKDFLENVIK